MASFESTAADLRKAVAQGAYAQAERILVEYRRQLEALLPGLPAGGSEAEELEREARALLEWARHVALASRATAAARLKRLSRPCAAYRAAPARARHTWELHA